MTFKAVCDKIFVKGIYISEGVKTMKICVYGAASDKIEKKYKDAAYLLGEKMAQDGHSLVFGGGDNGVMGAVARGAYENGGEIIGISPSFFDVDGVLFEHCTELIYTETMRERKQKLEDEGEAYIIAPGGVGTLDEFFEILTLKQLQQHNKAIVIYNVEGFFDDILSWMKNATDKEFISDMTLGLCKVTDDAKEAIEYIESYVPQEEDIYRLRNLLEEKR